MIKDLLNKFWNKHKSKFFIARNRMYGVVFKLSRILKKLIFDSLLPGVAILFVLHLFWDVELNVIALLGTWSLYHIIDVIPEYIKKFKW